MWQNNTYKKIKISYSTDYPVLNFLRGVSAINSTRFQISVGHRTGGKYGILIYSYTRTNNRLSAYPGAIFDGNWFYHQIETRLRKIMVTRKDKRTLRNTNIIA